MMKLFCVYVTTHATVFHVDIAPDKTIHDLKDAIKRTMANTFAHFGAGQLDLFIAKRGDTWLADDAQRAEVDDLLTQPLDVTARVGNVFQNLAERTIHVVVTDDRWRLANAPLKRKARWDRLNRELMDLADGRNANNTIVAKVAYASITWDDVRAVFDPWLDETYQMPVTPVPEATLAFLERMIAMKQASYRSMMSSDAALGLLFAEPILLAVASLLTPTGHIEVDKRLDGEYVTVEGTIDMVLTQEVAPGEYKRVCVVEATTDDMYTAMAQALVAMEVVSQLDRVETTFGIVTNFTRWKFLKRSDKTIGVEEDIVRWDCVREDVGCIVGKILSIFSSP